jgi:hypothetical protein
MSRVCGHCDHVFQSSENAEAHLSRHMDEYMLQSRESTLTLEDFNKTMEIQRLEREVIDAATAYRKVWGEFWDGQSQPDESGSRLGVYTDAHDTLLAVVDKLIEERGK